VYYKSENSAKKPAAKSKAKAKANAKAKKQREKAIHPIHTCICTYTSGARGALDALFNKLFYLIFL